jgi:hypothetical protein
MQTSLPSSLMGSVTASVGAYIVEENAMRDYKKYI